MNKLGMAEILNYIGVTYETEEMKGQLSLYD